MLGFEIAYERPGFAFLQRERAQLMLDELQDDSWLLDAAPHPFGHGLNLQIECADVEALNKRARLAGARIFRDLADASYAAGAHVIRQRQFIVVDPDGYLLRFCQRLLP